MMQSRTSAPVSSEALGGLLVLASLLAFAIVWYAQTVLKLAPCELCLWERRPWAVLLVLGLLSAVLPGRFARWMLVAGCACLLTSVGLAILHAGVEHKFWASPAPECRAPVFHGGSFKDWMANMPDRPNKPCDSPDYLFGLPVSMTELGGLYALFLFVVTSLGTLRLFTRRPV